MACLDDRRRDFGLRLSGLQSIFARLFFGCKTRVKTRLIRRATRTAPLLCSAPTLVRRFIIAVFVAGTLIYMYIYIYYIYIYI